MLQANLGDIDNYNQWNPLAVFGITERADWTAEERARVRGMKSSTLASSPDNTAGLSSWEILKDHYPDQDAMRMGEVRFCYIIL